MKVVPKTTYVDQQTGQEVTLEACHLCSCNVFYIVGAVPDSDLVCANCGNETPITVSNAP